MSKNFKEKRLIKILLLLITLLIFQGGFINNVKAQENIIIEGADAIIEHELVNSTNLDNAIEDIEPRIIVEYLDTLIKYGLINSTILDDMLENVDARIIVEYADTIIKNNLIRSPNLDTALADIDPRIIVEYLDTLIRYNLINSTILDNILENVEPRIIVEYADTILKYKLILNNPPNEPTSVGQFKSDGVSIMEETGTINESTIVFKGFISDPNGDDVRLEIELREYGQIFTGTPTIETISDYVSNGTEVVISRSGLNEGDYHWQYRAKDIYGQTSSWQEYGTEGNIDFIIDITGDNRIKGIDVSHWQRDINWTKVYNDGIKFAFVKASEGIGWEDDKFITNMKNSTNAGILAGAYHYALPQHNDPADEALSFINIVEDYLKDGYLRPVLDIEEGVSLGKENLTNWIHTWMDTVKTETGIEPILYTYSNFAEQYLDDSLKIYDLWIAHYTYNLTKTPNIQFWDDWAFWQYDDLGSVEGIEGNALLDVFNGDMNKLKRFIIDLTPPIVDNPADITYYKGTTGHIINWTATDIYPNIYIILKDGIEIDSGVWISGTPIIVDVNGLDVGEYNYTIFAVDLADNSASDTVIVSVIEPESNEISGFPWIILLFSFMLGVIVVLLKRKITSKLVKNRKR